MAEDAVQQALISAWREPRLREVDRYEMWLQRLLINACYQELRQLRRWKERVVPLPLEGPAAADLYRSADERDALDRAFARLSPTGERSSCSITTPDCPRDRRRDRRPADRDSEVPAPLLHGDSPGCAGRRRRVRNGANA